MKILIAFGNCRADVIDIGNEVIRQKISDKAGRLATTQTQPDPRLSKRTEAAMRGAPLPDIVPPNTGLGNAAKRLRDKGRKLAHEKRYVLRWNGSTRGCAAFLFSPLPTKCMVAQVQPRTWISKVVFLPQRGVIVCLSRSGKVTRRQGDDNKGWPRASSRFHSYDRWAEEQWIAGRPSMSWWSWNDLCRRCEELLHIVRLCHNARQFIFGFAICRCVHRYLFWLGKCLK